MGKALGKILFFIGLVVGIVLITEPIASHFIDSKYPQWFLAESMRLLMILSLYWAFNRFIDSVPFVATPLAKSLNRPSLVFLGLALGTCLILSTFGISLALG